MKPKLFIATFTAIAGGLIIAVPLLAAAELKPSQTYSLPPSSGFVDDNGKPISQEDYDKIVAQEEKNYIARYPIASVVVGGVLAAGATGFVAIKRRSKNTPTPLSTSGSQPLMPVQPTATPINGPQPTAPGSPQPPQPPISPDPPTTAV